MCALVPEPRKWDSSVRHRVTGVYCFLMCFSTVAPVESTSLASYSNIFMQSEDMYLHKASLVWHVALNEILPISSRSSLVMDMDEVFLPPGGPTRTT